MSTGAAAAVELDLALDALLVERRPSASPNAGPEDGDLLATARLLRDRLPRYHPRFGFEEGLLRRLGAGSTAPATILRLPDRQLALEPVAHATVVLPATNRRVRLAGGALASSLSVVIPLAGAALVAWRRGRVPGSGP